MSPSPASSGAAHRPGPGRPTGEGSAQLPSSFLLCLPGALDHVPPAVCPVVDGMIRRLTAAEASFHQARPGLVRPGVIVRADAQPAFRGVTGTGDLDLP